MGVNLTQHIYGTKCPPKNKKNQRITHPRGHLNTFSAHRFIAQTFPPQTNTRRESFFFF